LTQPFYGINFFLGNSGNIFVGAEGFRDLTAGSGSFPAAAGKKFRGQGDKKKNEPGFEKTVYPGSHKYIFPANSGVLVPAADHLK
jgi:hypothetical protein